MGVICADKYFDRAQTDTLEKWTVEAEKYNSCYEFTIPLKTSDLTGKSIAIQSSHFEMEVYISDELVYELKAGNPSFSKSTGFHWNFIRLNDADAGKTMLVKIIPHYNKVIPDTVVYYGSELAIYKNIVTSNIIRLIAGFFMLIIGIFTIVYVNLTQEKENTDSSMKYFSLFSICLALWTITESPICDLFSRYPTANMVVDHYALMFMPITYVMYIRNMFVNKRSKSWDICISVSVAVVILRSVLQIFAVLDLEQSLWLTHIAILVFIVIGTTSCVGELIRGAKTKWAKINILCILVTVVATVVELVLYLATGRTGIYGMIGFVIYVTVTSFEMVKRSQKTIARAQEAELYHKLAYTDVLTGIYNRLAFVNDTTNRIKREVNKPNAVFMIDLNDLKLCNDNFGHENGDRYIKMVSAVLERVFGDDGRCYRIGGDEFCAIVPDIRQSAVDYKLEQLNSGIDELNGKGFVVPVSIAVGCAIFDSRFDKSLSDTLKRADELMYKNKKKMKMVKI
jgi:diguanylate cyclase (GGDEF)-like protein